LSAAKPTALSLRGAQRRSHPVAHGNAPRRLRPRRPVPAPLRVAVIARSRDRATWRPRSIRSIYQAAAVSPASLANGGGLRNSPHQLDAM